MSAEMGGDSGSRILGDGEMSYELKSETESEYCLRWFDGFGKHVELKERFAYGYGCGGCGGCGDYAGLCR
jgi:hypothetical protein